MTDMHASRRPASASALRRCSGAALLLAGLATTGCGGPSDNGAPVVPPTEVTAVSTPRPDYPIELACAGVGGEVVLGLTVGIDGKPANVQLVRTSGNAALDQAAIAGVDSWQFKPATRNGQPRTHDIQVPMNFRPPQVRPEQCFALDAQS